jgi:hypothetical protein
MRGGELELGLLAGKECNLQHFNGVDRICNE